MFLISYIKMSFRIFRIMCIQLLTISAKREICMDCVIIAPHPDDETFGCGQLIAESVRFGKHVEVIICSDGVKSHNNCCDIAPEILREAREKNAIDALQILGLAPEFIHFLRLPDGALCESIASNQVKMMELLNSFQISTIFIPNLQEGWSDHNAVAELGDCLANNGWNVYFYSVWLYFSMPFRNFRKVCWSNACYIASPQAREKKLLAMHVYLNHLAPCGVAYAGVLPKELCWAIARRKELYFLR